MPVDTTRTPLNHNTILSPTVPLIQAPISLLNLSYRNHIGRGNRGYDSPRGSGVCGRGAGIMPGMEKPNGGSGNSQKIATARHFVGVEDDAAQNIHSGNPRRLRDNLARPCRHQWAGG